MSDRRLQMPMGGIPGRLVRQLAALLIQPGAAVPIFPMLVVEGVESRPWSSATFEGERHRFDLRLHGEAEALCDTVDRLVTLLPSLEFDLPGQIVAEARLTSLIVDPDPAAVAVAFTIEVLTVVD